MCDIVLDVHENPMSANGLRYATVEDSIQLININPPNCNCQLAVNRDAERKRIADDMERNRNGVCRHLMDLNGTWDNFEVDGTTYLKKLNAVLNLFPLDDGEGITLGDGAYNIVKNNADRQELYEEVKKKHGIKGNFEFRTNVEMNIYYGNNSDESYKVEGGVSGVIVEPLENKLFCNNDIGLYVFSFLYHS